MPTVSHRAWSKNCDPEFSHVQPDIDHEGKIGEVFFFAAWYKDTSLQEEVPPACCFRGRSAMVLIIPVGFGISYASLKRACEKAETREPA